MRLVWFRRIICVFSNYHYYPGFYGLSWVKPKIEKCDKCGDEIIKPEVMSIEEHQSKHGAVAYAKRMGFIK